MDLIHFVFVCFVLITTCSAEEEAAVKEFNNLTVLEPQLSCQKREKQYLIEDEPCEPPEQKRDERQSVPIKNRDSKIINIRLLPKKVPVNIKQTQPPGLSKPVNVLIDKTPKRIPIKVPVILKTRVVPAPAHTMRMKMMDKELHNTVHINQENTLASNATDPDNVPKDNIPNTSENSTPKTDLRSGPNKVDEVISSNNSNDTYPMDDQDNADTDEKITDSKDTGKKPKTNEINHEEESKQGEKTKKFSKPEPKPVYFFVDEPEPLPPPIKKRKPASKNDDDESPTKKSKNIPLVKNNKPKKNERTDDDLDTDDDPNIIQITNGTHIISIKKISHDRRKGEDKVSSDGSEKDLETEDRIMNEPPLRSNEPEKVSLKNKNNDDSMKVEKDKNGCITITKHNYEEFEEKAPNPPPAVQVQTATLPIGSQDPWNYLQIPPNFNNPYYQNVYENCAPAQITPPVQNVDNANSYTFTPDSQIYFANEVNIPAYNSELNQYTPNTANPEIDNVLNQLPRLETLDRIWRAWKDVEIKIRNAHKYEDPFLIDIRRNMADHNDGNINKGDNVNGKGSLPSLPINSYLNNQNNGNHYPYVKPNYRYTR